MDITLRCNLTRVLGGGNEVLSGSKGQGTAANHESNGTTIACAMSDKNSQIKCVATHVGLVVNTASPELLSVFPPAALKNLLYPEVGM